MLYFGPESYNKIRYMDAEKTLLEAQLKRIITKLFKDFLIIAEDIRQDHLAVLSDMKQFPQELLVKWNYLDLAKYSRIRKKVLDAGNDSIREVKSALDHFDIVLNPKIDENPENPPLLDR